MRGVFIPNFAEDPSFLSLKDLKDIEDASFVPPPSMSKGGMFSRIETFKPTSEQLDIFSRELGVPRDTMGGFIHKNVERGPLTQQGIAHFGGQRDLYEKGDGTFAIDRDARARVERTKIEHYDKLGIQLTPQEKIARASQSGRGYMVRQEILKELAGTELLKQAGIPHVPIVGHDRVGSHKTRPE